MVVDDQGRLAGIFTDGDLRRLVERKIDFMPLTAREVMTRSPKTIAPSELAEKALNLMESHKITALPVIDQSQVPVGIIHIHDILQRKIA